MTSIPEPERLRRAEIRQIQQERLQRLLSEVGESNPFWRERFQEDNVRPAEIRSLEDLARLPLTCKRDLVADHQYAQPFGSNLTYPRDCYSRMHQTSGTTGRPLRWLDTPDSWSWFAECWAQIYRLAGVRLDDCFFFPFSFGPFIGFWAAFEGASRRGHLIIPGGGLSSEARLRMMIETGSTILCCTPTYAMRLAEVARREGIDIAASPVRLLIVAGEPGGNVPGTKAQIESAWNATVIDHWGMTEIGSLATAAIGDPTGLYMLETECIAEILDPESGQPVPAGDLGELVVTNLGRIGSPLIRYRTGDLVRAATEPSPVGLKLLRLEGGILGRVDDMVTIRGNNVFPSSIEAVVRDFPNIVEFRITIQTQRAMKHIRLDVEPGEGADSEEIRHQLSRAIRDRLNFSAEIACVPPASLPRFELKGRRLLREDQ